MYIRQFVRLFYSLTQKNSFKQYVHDRIQVVQVKVYCKPQTNNMYRINFTNYLNLNLHPNLHKENDHLQ